MIPILIVDDDANQRKVMHSILCEEGYQVCEADSADQSIALLDDHQFSVILTDLKMPGKSGIDLVQVAAALPCAPEIVVITAFGSIDSAVRAMRLGAYDYLTKPIEHDELIVLVERAQEKFLLRQSNAGFRNEQLRKAQESIIARSDAMQAVLETARRVAAADSTVLIRGESGTGKERIARFIHALSPRSNRPLQCINCAAFPDTLLESELFGYERGAFTGAVARKAGLLEAADGSTVFLDEVADMSLPLQAKLLRVLQEKEIRRLGATASMTIDVRFVAATNKNLEECVKAGSFREDLFYRLNIIPITLAPLRQRPQDIAPLIDLFLGRRSQKIHLDDEARRYLINYPWPGNVRELEAIIERLAVLCPGTTITREQLPHEIRMPFATTPETLTTLPPEGIVFEEWEKSLLEQALAQSRGVMTEAARLLGMTYRTFQYRVEKFGLTARP